MSEACALTDENPKLTSLRRQELELLNDQGTENEELEKREIPQKMIDSEKPN